MPQTTQPHPTTPQQTSKAAWCLTSVASMTTHSTKPPTPASNVQVVNSASRSLMQNPQTQVSTTPTLTRWFKPVATSFSTSASTSLTRQQPQQKQTLSSTMH